TRCHPAVTICLPPATHSACLWWDDSECDWRDRAARRKRRRLVVAIAPPRTFGPTGEYLLLVAEDPGLVMELTELFSSAGYAVAGVRTAPLALAAIQLARPGLILY